jgi:putative NADPH-quinone reductase
MALVILAHPHFEKSFANKTILEELQKSDLNVEIRNIQSLYPDYKIDVKAEQEALLRHQTIVFQYPFYWLNIPAILKLWFDEVFSYQFAYGSKGDKLKGKDFVPSITVGGSEDAYKITGKHHARIYEFCKNIEQTAYYAQMNYVDPFFFFGTSTNLEGHLENEIKDRAKDHTKRLTKQLKQLAIDNQKRQALLVTS